MAFLKKLREVLMSKTWLGFVITAIIVFVSSVTEAQSSSNASEPSAIGSNAETSVEIGGSLKTGTLAADKDEMKGGREQWFLGAYWRHLWVPRFMQKVFFEQAPSISTGLFKLEPNIGLVATWRNASGFALQFGLGHSSYRFKGYFRTKGDPIDATEYARSTLDFWYGTVAALWSAEIVKELAVEFGFGLDLGLLTGDIERTEAYYDRNGWHPCRKPLDPALQSSDGVTYCAKPRGGAATDPPDKFGEHYHVKVGKMGSGGKIPPIVPIPTIPMLALRFAPIRDLVIKWELGYSIIEFWTGASLHYALWTEPAPPPAPPELRVVEKPVLIVKGRIKGVVVEEGTGTPIAGASVQFVGKEGLSPIQTVSDGRFVSYEFEAGEIAMEVSHPDYENNVCNAVIGKSGSEVPVTCTLVVKPKVGIIDGYVYSSSGPVTGAKVDLTGPVTRTAISDANGIFRVGDAAPGDYTVRVAAEKFMVKLTQVTAVVKETVPLKIELTELPRETLVKVEDNEIKIEQQINFGSNSATIKADSTPLMTQIADAFLRYPEIRRVEIQGHTDSRGNDAYNLDLSQRRAEAVRQWLINAGVAAERMVAKGYGETVPLASNKTKDGRARNRRVQFIIKERAQEAR
jgi:outer membrane protein OmpA-like peptidoglycan-associated protein